ncbi:DUF4405 domain-containing protein [Desulfofundulus sp. TPOSR]|uniref:DUF4405 domain-containing protein n=1 Tax=Desulfofundulus sp. TPOSR TaxID=2714340 RepID=UPI00140A01A3|nr:DUF4405 domain-containing protein [Desulfofundulus sp. TPOSR]NHM26620.1 DUF4405 domain-containing protein [Desulfofundulus sp. TPOSR]
MLRAWLNYWLGWLLFLAGLGLAVSGLVKWLILPGGGRGGFRGEEAVFIFARHTWTEIHQWLAVVIMVLVVLHIYLHWNWIATMSRQIFGRKRL